MREKVFCGDRLWGRFFLCLISVLVMVASSHASGPGMTTISDVVYRANGDGAFGTIVITWPAFTTRDNKAVAAGELSVAIGGSGLVTLALAPNEGATPTGTYYKAVYKLGDGTTSTEYWIVPASSPTTIAAVRATVVPTQVAAQLASRAYVDNAVAGTSSSVVHIAGSESITGAKSFSVSPTAPTPTSATSVANKAYVDAAVTGVTGSYVRTTGDTMTGQLTLAADPVAPNQAANRHYVDLQTSTLTGGLSSKLGRLNDSPITLAGVRYADQFTGATVGAQIDSACADLAGANGTVVIPSTLGAGWSLNAVPSNCTVADWRGNGGSTQTAYVRGTGHYNRVTSVGAGLQIPLNALFEFDAYSGGVNDINTTKTQWQNIRTLLHGRTIGERKGVVGEVRTYGKGDSIGGMFSTYDWGGYNTGGDESSVGIRASTSQGFGPTSIPTGTVTAVNGNTITAAWNSGTNAYIGEQRPLINTSRGVYSTGTLASGSGIAPFTIVGSGTSWLTLGSGAVSDLFLEYTAYNGDARFVIPILSIVDNTHLTAEYNLSGLGATSFNPSGAYKIFKGGIVSSLAAPPFGSFNPSAVNLAAGGSDFQLGDTIEQPLGYNYLGQGATVVLQRFLNSSSQGGGVYVINIGNYNYRDAFRASGNFDAGISFDNNLAAGVKFTGSVGTLVQSYDTAAVTQSVLQLLNGSSALRQLTYDRPNDMWTLGGVRFSGSDQRIGVGTAPQANTHSYFYYNNSAWDGLIVAPVTVGASQAIFDTQVSGVSRLRVENTKVKVNNGVDVVGYSDNQTTQKWGVTGSTGAGRFDGGITSGTVNTTGAFQINGSALNFSNVAGVVAASQMPALMGDVTTSAGTVATTLANAGTAGTYTKVITDAKGRVIAGLTAQFSDIGGTSTKTQAPATDVYTDQSNTFTTGTQDLSGAAHTLPAVKGTIAGKPATCTQGEQYFATDATAGQNLYFCTAANTWTQQLNSGGGGVAGSGTVNSIAKFVTNTTTLGNSNITDDGTTVTVSSAMARTGTFTATEIAAPSNPASGKQISWADSGSHTQLCKLSDGTPCRFGDFFDTSVLEWQDECLGGGVSGFTSGGANFCDKGWVLAGQLGGGIGHAQTTTNNEIGIGIVQTGATSGNGVRQVAGDLNAGSPVLFHLFTRTTWKYKFRIALAQTTSTSFYGGLGQYSANPPTSFGCGLRYDTNLGTPDTNFMLYCTADGTTFTAVTTGVPADTAFHTITMYCTASGTVVLVFDDGAGAKTQTISTNVSTTGSPDIGFSITTRTSASASYYFDFARLRVTGLVR